MSENTIRRKLKESNCMLKVTTEMYSGAKCYKVINKDNNIVAQDSDLDSLAKRLFD